MVKIGSDVWVAPDAVVAIEPCTLQTGRCFVWVRGQNEALDVDASASEVVKRIGYLPLTGCFGDTCEDVR